MKLWIAVVGLLCMGLSARAEDFNLTAEKLKFEYQPDEAAAVDCTHKIENPASQDWKVVCRDGSWRREYTVHLWLTEYHFQTGPNMSWEILYWVTDWTDKTKPVSHGTTSWVHLKDKSSLFRLDLSQHVDGGTASLKLQLTP